MIILLAYTMDSCTETEENFGTYAQSMAKLLEHYIETCHSKYLIF